VRNSKRRAVYVGWLMMLAIFVFPSSAFSDVTLFAECAYTEDDLDCFIYADIDTGTELRAASFKLTYDIAEVTLDLAERASSIWYLGDAAPGFDTPNAIDTSTAGQVILATGKLDTTLTTSGVGGNRAPVGVVRFNRTGSTMPFSPTLSLSLGKPDPFDNVVQTDGVVLDDIGVTIGGFTVRERGDANADGNVTPADMLAVRNAYYGGLPLGCEPAADCNDDSTNIFPKVTPADMICIRNKYYAP